MRYQNWEIFPSHSAESISLWTTLPTLPSTIRSWLQKSPPYTHHTSEFHRSTDTISWIKSGIPNSEEFLERAVASCKKPYNECKDVGKVSVWVVSQRSKDFSFWKGPELAEGKVFAPCNFGKAKRNGVGWINRGLYQSAFNKINSMCKELASRPEHVRVHLSLHELFV